MIDLSNQEPNTSYYSNDDEIDACMDDFKFLCNGLLKLDEQNNWVHVIDYYILIDIEFF